ncbi:hypothetical protein HDU92_005998 [Lobulomyces angularis]|nr:hypothetical protein HDU92_005998 [Lobulomyces angularis]
MYLKNWSVNSHRGAFQKLPEEVIIYLIQYHIPLSPTGFALMQVSKFWYQLYNSPHSQIFKIAAKERFRLDQNIANMYHLKCSSNEFLTCNDWRNLYLRMDYGITVWQGFAIDRATNAFKPYPMEINIENATRSIEDTSRNGTKTLKTEFEGSCRWKSLKNSLTKISGQITDQLGAKVVSRFDLDPFLNSPPPRTCSFLETKIIRGDDIAIPNHYYSMMVGPVLIGMYDPGHSAYMGCFILIMKEAIGTPSIGPYIENSIYNDIRFANSKQGIEIYNKYIKDYFTESSILKDVFNKKERSFRGILTHALEEGEKKGYHIELAFQTINMHEKKVEGTFTVMLVINKTENYLNRTLNVMEQIQKKVTWPCKLKFQSYFKFGEEKVINLDELNSGLSKKILENENSEFSNLSKKLKYGSLSENVNSEGMNANGGLSGAVNTPYRPNNGIGSRSNSTSSTDTANSADTVNSSSTDNYDYSNTPYENNTSNENQKQQPKLNFNIERKSEDCFNFNGTLEEEFKKIKKGKLRSEGAPQKFDEEDHHFDYTFFSKLNAELINPSFHLIRSEENSNGNSNNAMQSIEERIAESNWIESNIPIGKDFTLVRMGNVLAGMFNEPRVGVFYVNI